MMAAGLLLLVIAVVLHELTENWYMMRDGWLSDVAFRIHKGGTALIAGAGAVLILASVTVFLWRVMP